MPATRGRCLHVPSSEQEKGCLGRRGEEAWRRHVVEFFCFLNLNYITTMYEFYILYSAQHKSPYTHVLT